MDSFLKEIDTEQHETLMTVGMSAPTTIMPSADVDSVKTDIFSARVFKEMAVESK